MHYRRGVEDNQHLEPEANQQPLSSLRTFSTLDTLGMQGDDEEQCVMSNKNLPLTSQLRRESPLSSPKYDDVTAVKPPNLPLRLSSLPAGKKSLPPRCPPFKARSKSTAVPPSPLSSMSNPDR